MCFHRISIQRSLTLQARIYEPAKALRFHVENSTRGFFRQQTVQSRHTWLRLDGYYDPDEVPGSLGKFQLVEIISKYKIAALAKTFHGGVWSWSRVQ